jgi:hypothetical protein
MTIAALAKNSRGGYQVNENEIIIVRIRDTIQEPISY